MSAGNSLEVLKKEREWLDVLNAKIEEVRKLKVPQPALVQKSTNDPNQRKYELTEKLLILCSGDIDSLGARILQQDMSVEDILELLQIVITRTKKDTTGEQKETDVKKLEAIVSYVKDTNKRILEATAQLRVLSDTHHKQLTSINKLLKNQKLSGEDVEEVENILEDWCDQLQGTNVDLFKKVITAPTNTNYSYLISFITQAPKTQFVLGLIQRFNEVWRQERLSTLQRVFQTISLSFAAIADQPYDNVLDGLEDMTSDSVILKDLVVKLLNATGQDCGTLATI